MSKLNIYENSWINLVFENRNQEYGAYHLRQENTKTSFFALLMGVSILTAAISTPMVYNYLNPENRISPITPELPPVVVSYIIPIIPHQKQVEEVIPQIKKTVTEKTITSLQLLHPEIVRATEATTQVIATNVELTNITNTNPSGTEGSELGTGKPTGNTGTSTPTISSTTIIPVTALDKMPEFPGGIKKFYSFVGNNFEKPELDSDMPIRVSVSFVIERDGSMTDIKVLKDPGYGLGAEAIRVLKSLRTKWAPGMIKGQAVRTSYNLPITIQAN